MSLLFLAAGGLVGRVALGSVLCLGPRSIFLQPRDESVEELAALAQTSEVCAAGVILDLAHVFAQPLARAIQVGEELIDMVVHVGLVAVGVGLALEVLGHDLAGR